MIARYSPHTVRRWSGDQNCRDRQVLHRQSGAVSRIGCEVGMLLHQHSGAGASHTNGSEQLAQCFFIG